MTARQRRKAWRSRRWRIDYTSGALTVQELFVQARRVEAYAVEPVIVIERVRL